MSAKKSPQSLFTLGVLGGTFDPIHIGHLIIAQTLLEKLQLSQVLFLISAWPPHKQPAEVVPWKHRLEMVELAIKDNPNFAISDLEIQRNGPSYTAETIDILQAQYGLRHRILFIVGADSILEISAWRHPERLLKSGSLVVVPRPGFDLSRLDPQVAEKVTMVKTPLLEVSSSNIRQRISQGKSIRYLVPQKVENYIRRKGLYR